MTSPIIEGTVEPMLLNFPDAMYEVIKGKKIKRKEWEDKNEYGIFMDAKLMIMKHDDSKFHPWIISEGDLLADDWYTIS